MNAYVYSPVEAEDLLAKKGLSPSELAERIRSDSIKHVAKEIRIGYTRLLAIISALGIDSGKELGYQKIGRKHREAHSVIVKSFIDSYGTEAVIESIRSMTMKEFCSRYDVSKITYQRICEGLHVSSEAPNPSSARARQRFEGNMKRHKDLVSEMMARRCSYSEIAKAVNLSKRQTDKLIHQIDPDYSVVGQNWFTRNPEDAQRLMSSKLSDARSLIYDNLQCPSSAVVANRISTRGTSLCQSELFFAPDDVDVLSWMSRRRNVSIVPEVSEFLASFDIDIPERFLGHADLYRAYVVLHNSNYLAVAIGRFMTLQDMYDFFSVFGRNSIIQSVSDTVDNPTSFLPVRVNAVYDAVDRLGVDRITKIVSDARSRSELEKSLGMSAPTTQALMKRLGITPQFSMSSFETKVCCALTRIGADFEFRRKGILENGRMELDFYLPKNNIAIEVNPTHTHNSLYGWNYDPRNALSKSYHFSKFKMCEKANIKLLSLYEKDLADPNWTNITLPYLEFLIRGARRVFYGRQTRVSVCVSENEKRAAREFFSRYHFQGNVKASSYYCVSSLSGEILGYASFGKPESNKYQGSAELKRVAFVPDVQVRFGLSKIVKHFFDDHPDINSIVSYSRNDMGGGESYRAAGFEYIGMSSPTPVFINPCDPYDSYRWPVATSWSAKKGIISRQIGESAMSNAEAYRFVVTEMKRRTGSGVGYVPVYESGSKIWKKER